MDRLLLGDVVPLLPWFHEAGWISARELEQVREIEELLAAVSGSEYADLWQFPALDGMAWQQVRERAERFVADR